MLSHIPWVAGELQSLVSDPASQIICETRRLSVMLQPFHLKDVKSSVHDILLGNIDRYDHKLKGIVLNYEHLQIVSNCGTVAEESSVITVDVIADVFIFRPKVGNVLKGVVNKISKDHVGVLLHRRFNVSCPRPHSDEKSSKWLGNQVGMHQEVTFKLKDTSFSGRLPYFKGKLLSCGKVLNVTSEEDHEVPKKRKKPKKDVKEHEVCTSSTPSNEKSSKSKKRPGGSDIVDVSIKKMKLEDSTKELPNEPQKTKKKRVNLPSIDEVDFFPKIQVNESFLSKCVLPDQFSSPMANSTYFETGKLLSSQKKAKDKSKKSKAEGLCDINEESSKAASALTQTSSHINKNERRTKNVTTVNTSTTGINPKEEKIKLKEERMRSKEKKKKTLEDESAQSLLTQQSIELEALRTQKKKVKSPLQPTSSISDQLTNHQGLLSPIGASSKRKKEKNTDISATSMHSFEIEPAKTPKSKDKSQKKDKHLYESSSMLPDSVLSSQEFVIRKRDAKSFPQEVYMSSHQGDTTPEVKKTKKAEKKTKSVNEGNLSDTHTISKLMTPTDIIDTSKKSSAKKAVNDSSSKKPDSKSKDKTDSHTKSCESPSKRKLQNKPGMSDNERLFVTESLLRSAGEEEITSATKKKEKSKRSSGSKEVLSSIYPVSSDQLEIAGKIITEVHTARKQKSKTTYDEVDSILSDDITPGQRLKAISPQKWNEPVVEKSPMKYFPGNSITDPDLGINKSIKISPLVFGSIQGKIPSPPHSEENSSDSDSPKVKAFTSKSKVISKKIVDGSKKLKRKETVPASNVSQSVTSPVGHATGNPLKLTACKNDSASSSSSDSEVGSTRLASSGLPNAHSPMKSDESGPRLTTGKDVSSLFGKILGSVTPKKIISGKMPTHFSKKESTKDMSRDKMNEDKEKSSDEEPSNIGKQLTQVNKFLESMGVIQSPFKPAHVPEHQSSDSDSDSTPSADEKSNYTFSKTSKSKKSPAKVTKDITSLGHSSTKGISNARIDKKGLHLMGQVAKEAVSAESLKKNSAKSKSSSPSSKLASVTESPSNLPHCDSSSDSDDFLQLMRTASLNLEKKKLGAKQRTKKSQVAPKAQLTVQPITASVKPGNVLVKNLGNHGNKPSDSDSGPDDRNTTLLIEKHRKEQEVQIQKRNTKSRKTSKTVPGTLTTKAEPQRGTKTPSTEVSFATAKVNKKSSEGVSLKRGRKKGSSKEQSASDNDIAEIMQRIMGIARKESDK